MVDIRHRVGIKAPLDDVHERLGTCSGLESWWTPDVRGDAELGGKLSFYNGGPSPMVTMEVTALEPQRLVAWRCIDGPDEWKDTTVTFEVEQADGESVIMFTHAGWREPVEFLHHCSTKWAYYLLGLKARLEGLTGSPWSTDAVKTWG